jgi:hypothetical protein
MTLLFADAQAPAKWSAIPASATPCHGTPKHTKPRLATRRGITMNTTQIKVFTDRSNCRRAALKESAGANFTIEPVIMAGNKRGFRWAPIAVIEPNDEAVETREHVKGCPAQDGFGCRCAEMETAAPPIPPCGLKSTRPEALVAARLAYGPAAVVGEQITVKKTARGEWFWGAFVPEPEKVVSIAKERAARASKGAPAGVKPDRLQILVDLLGRPQGATLAEVSAATGWQEHSARARIGSDLVHAGHTIARAGEERGRVYRIVLQAAQQTA